MNPEKERLNKEDYDAWHKWGPYLSDRQWGTVREDYSANGDAWNYFTHEAALSRTYRWGEDGIGGISDNEQFLCFSLAFWNGNDPILKERFFGLTQFQGNHGEDVKEYYYYLDNTSSHSYMKMLYKYPKAEFPYSKLIEINGHRGKKEKEFELIDTGIFDYNRYCDIFIEYAKNNPEDILIKITVFNRDTDTANLNIIPQLWYRNTWSRGYDDYRPVLKMGDNNCIEADHKQLGKYNLYCEENPEFLFCENDSNLRKLFNVSDAKGFYKDGINEYIVHQDLNAVNPQLTGTKVGLNYKISVSGQSFQTIRLRLSKTKEKLPFNRYDDIFFERIKETDAFYNEVLCKSEEEDVKRIQRQALAGLLWSKQFYYYDIQQWLDGDPGQPKPPSERINGRNNDWFHLNNRDIISMPDKWEYPWYAAWDLAFHCVIFSVVDPVFAKKQLLLLTREWYMHPNGELPAYEWNFSNVNPPVHAWASWRVYKIDKKLNGEGDIRFLESVFHKLLLNFTWWVNRKDLQNHNIFQGGFLGLDNIGLFDRNDPLPSGIQMEQADATAWMAMFSLNMLRIALELSKVNPVYQDLATKFLEHFLYIAGAMTNIDGKGINLWNDEDQFFYNVLHTENKNIQIKIRSMVGLIPLFAVEVIDPETIKQCPEFGYRMDWFLKYRPDLANLVSHWEIEGKGLTRLFSLLRGHRLKKLLYRMLDENEFLSDFGVRALSKIYEENPYELNLNGEKFSVNYEPGESENYMFGGNSNWRGPVWFPMNFLIIESLQRFHHYYGDDFKVEYPTHSGNYLTLLAIAEELTKRLSAIFLRDKNGKRPVFGENRKFQEDIYFNDYLLFYEYFHGDHGKGLGASHQTGWTALISKLLVPKEENQPQ
jgi:hypothetical protein